jgi:hypothetical protein
VKRMIICGALVFSIAVVFVFWARQRVWSYSELEPACEEKTQEVLAANGSTPTEWTPSLRSTLGGGLLSRGLLNQYGRWRVGQQHVEVLCSAKVGESTESIGFEISKPQ